MSPVVIALLFGAGAATWVYTKVLRTTGGNSKNSLVVAGVAFAFAFVAMLLIMNAADRALQ